jgi:hypothetical protein
MYPIILSLWIVRCVLEISHIRRCCALSTQTSRRRGRAPVAMEEKRGNEDEDEAGNARYQDCKDDSDSSED